MYFRQSPAPANPMESDAGGLVFSVADVVACRRDHRQHHDGRLLGVYRVRDAGGKVGQAFRNKLRGPAVARHLKPSLQRLHEHRHRGRMLAELLARVEGEQHHVAYGQLPAGAGPGGPGEYERRINKVVNIHTTTQLQVVLVKPERFENASEIADHLREKRTVVLNLESTNKEIARRLLDFLSGVAYAGEGKIKKVAANTYIITPYHVDIEGDLIDELENNGLYF